MSSSASLSLWVRQRNNGVDPPLMGAGRGDLVHHEVPDDCATLRAGAQIPRPSDAGEVTDQAHVVDAELRGLDQALEGGGEAWAYG